MSELNDTAHAILGLLTVEEMSGGELAAFAQRSIAYFWPITRSQIYRELERLEEDGRITSQVVAQRRYPDKRVYRLSDHGRATFTAWLSAPGYPPERRRIGLLLKVFFGQHLQPDEFAGLLARHRAEVEAELAELTAIVDRLERVSEARFARATARYGVEVARARQVWIEQMQEELRAVEH